MYKQADRHNGQTDWQTDGQTDKRTDRETERETATNFTTISIPGIDSPPHYYLFA